MSDDPKTYNVEKGSRVPVMTREGQLYTVDAEDAQGILDQGGHLPTTPDLMRAYDQEHAQAMRQFDMPVTAAVMGATRSATGGLSDVGISALGGKLGLQQLKEQNPLATLTGEVGGAFLPGVGTLAGAAGKGIAGLTAVSEGASAAAKIASNYGGRALSGLAEGGIFGLGSGVTEAALGDPDHIADNLLTGFGHGALWGGGLGAGFGALTDVAVPALSKLTSKFSSKAAEIVSNLAETGGTRIAQAKLARMGETELADQLPGILSKDFQDAIKSGDLDKADALIKEAQGTRGTLMEEAKTLQGQLDKRLAEIPKDEQAAFTKAITDAGGDLNAGVHDLTGQIKSDTDKLEAFTHEKLAQYEPINKQGLVDASNTAVKSLTARGTNATDALVADSVKEMRDSWFKPMENAGEEVRYALEFRSKVNGLLKTYSGEMTAQGRQALGGFSSGKGQGVLDAVNTFLEKEHPADLVKDVASKIRLGTAGKDQMLKLLSGSPGKIEKFFHDPEAFPRVMTFMKNADRYLPEIQAFKKAGTDAIAQREATKAAYLKYMHQDETAKWAGTRLSETDMHDALKMLGGVGPKEQRAFDRVQEIKKAIDPALHPLDQAIAINRAAGTPIADLEKLLPIKDKMDAFSRLNALARPELEASDRMARAGMRYGAVHLAHAVGIPAPLATAAAMALHVASMNPARMVRTIQGIQSAADKGAKLFSKASDAVVGAMTGKTVEKAAKAFASLSPTSERGPKERQETFQKMRAAIGRYSSNPNAMADAQSRAFGNMDQMPQVKQALMTRSNAAMAYLQAALPPDRTAGYSVLPGSAPSVASDAETTKFLRQADVVNNPLVAMKRISEGTVTPEEIQALKAVHPDVYSKLQQDVVGGIMDHASQGGEIPYASKLTLANVFGVPTDYSLSPGFVQRMQKQLLPANEGGRPQGAADSAPRKSRVDLKPFETVQTPGDQLAYKGSV